MHAEQQITWSYNDDPPYDSDPPQLRLIEGGLLNPVAEQEGSVCVDGHWYTAAQWLEVLGIGQGYAKYADRRPLGINWLISGGDPESVLNSAAEYEKLAESSADPDTYLQPTLQQGIRVKDRLAAAVGALLESGSL